MRRSGVSVRVAVVALGLAVALAGSVACSGGGSGGSGGGGTTVKGSEYKFDPATITVDAGKPVTLNFENTGTVDHDWEAQGVAGAQVPSTPAKGKKSITFTPTTPGTYKTLCTLPGHADAGMVGQLIVK